MIQPRSASELLLAVLAYLAGLSGCGPATIQPSAKPDRVAAPTTIALAEPTEDAAVLPASGVTLRGLVRFDGSPPQRRVIKMNRDAECVKLHGDKTVLDESLIVGAKGGVQNAFVYIRRGAPKADYAVPAKAVELVQENCMYRPRVQGMMAGQTLRVLNEDPLTHNVRSIPVRNKAFNFGQPADSEPRERVFSSPEREIEIQCDIHPWMHAYLFVMDHPFYAVSSDDGAFAIENLPPGKYVLGVWHEVLGKQDREVSITADTPPDIEFRFQR